MANIRLKELVEANVDPKLVARSKETGKLVYFKSPENKAAAMKAGTHEDPKSKKGDEPKADVKPNDMFGGDYAKDRGGEAPKADVKSIVKDLLKKGDKEFRGAYKLADVVDDFKDSIDDTDEDGKELKARLDKGEDGTYVQTDETEGTVVFNDGSQYEFSHVEDGPIPVTKVGKEEPKTSSKLSTMMPKVEPTPKIVGNWKSADEDGRMSSDAADDVRNYLNDVLGVDGMAEVDFGSGNIAYGLSDSENSIYVGRENGTYNVSYEGPSVDIDTINNSYKSFKNPKDALTYAGKLAQANRKGLEQKQDTGE